MNTTIRPRLAFGGRYRVAGESFYGLPLFGRALWRAWTIFLLVALIGCVTSPAYKTLYAVGHATDAAVKTYFDLVVAGQVRTNDVPRIAKMYDDFQAAYRAAEAIAEFSPTARANTNITAKAASLIGEVAKAKGAQ